MRTSPLGRRDAVIAALLAVVSVAYLWPLRVYGYMLNDDGWYLHPTLRMLDGEILYRDVWTFYAPFEYHLMALLFRLGHPSILLARSLWVLLLALGVVGTYFVARRFAPPAIAWLPALVFALVPGQWSKAFYTLCTVSFLLAVAAVLDRPRPRRFLVLGMAVGFSVIARHDLGALQIVLAGGCAAALWLRPAAFGDDATIASRSFLARVATLAAGFGLVVVPVLVYYAAHDALADMIDATLIRGVAQRQGWYGPGLEALFSWRNPLGVAEGRLAGALLLSPLLIYVAAGVLLLRRLFRSGLGPETLFAGVLIAYGLAGLANTYYQMRLLRLLETGAPFYLTLSWLVVEATRSLRRPGLAGGIVLSSLAALFVASILVGVPQFLPAEDYSGSMRMRGFQSPVKVLGDTLYVDAQEADELRLLRAFVQTRTQPDEPLFIAPLYSLYYPLLDRRNPTRVLGVHFREDKVLTDAQKQVEMEKLRRSGTRFAIVSSSWLGWPEAPDLIRRTLLEEFHPIRTYGSMLVLERDTDARDRRITEAYQSLARGGARPELLPELETLVQEAPDEPFPWWLLGSARLSLGQVLPAADAFDRAAALDPADPSGLEMAAQALAAAGQRAPAIARLRRALAVRESPRARALLEQLGR